MKYLLYVNFCICAEIEQFTPESPICKAITAIFFHALKLFLSYLFCFCLRTNYMLFPATLANLFQHCISVKRNALFPIK